MILDQFGRPVPPLKRPETREIAAVSLQDRWSGYPSAGLTPQRLTWILRAADAGDLYDQAELFEEMEEKDAHLASVLQTRKLAVTGLEWRLDPASEDPGDQEVADFCREALEALKLKSALLHLLDAVGKGFAACEIIWRVSGNRVVVDRLAPIPASASPLSTR